MEIDATPRCGTCRHFVKTPSLAAGPVLIGDGSSDGGECRHSPPATCAVPQRGGVAFLTTYPKIASDYPACSSHSPTVTLPR